MNTKIQNSFPLNISGPENLIFFGSILLLLMLLLLIMQYKNIKRVLRRLDKSDVDLKEEIRSSVQPKFLEISIEARGLIDLASEIWRLEQRLIKVSKKLQENHKKALENSVQKLKKFVDKYDLEVRDYTGQKYNTSLSAMEVVSVEKSSSVIDDIVKETLEPAVLLRGQIIKKAKVILISKK